METNAMRWSATTSCFCTQNTSFSVGLAPYPRETADNDPLVERIYGLDRSWQFPAQRVKKAALARALPILGEACAGCWKLEDSRLCAGLLEGGREGDLQSEIAAGKSLPGLRPQNRPLPTRGTFAGFDTKGERLLPAGMWSSIGGRTMRLCNSTLILIRNSSWLRELGRR